MPININHFLFLPIPVAARSNVWVCARSFVGIVDSNLAWGVDICLLRVFCVVG